MADIINRSNVIVDFKDIYGTAITDDVEIKIYNSQLQSLKQVFDVKFRGEPVTLPDLPAFPTGHAQIIVTPTRYRFKRRFINVEASQDNFITEYFFVDPAHAHPHPIDYDDLASKSYGGELLRILDAAAIYGNTWNGLDPLIRATILNLSAKMHKETVADGTQLLRFVEGIDRTWLDLKHRERIYARVPDRLLLAVRAFPQVFIGVSGDMHTFPSGWNSVPSPDSFKTLKDSAGNIQLTFAGNASQELLADIDLDDHKGIAHVADVLKHKFSGKETNPYDIQQILWFSQQLDTEYRLL